MSTFNNTTPTNFFDTQSNARASSSPFVDIFQSRDPTPNDITSATSINTYAIQQKWLNTTTQTLWELKNFTTSQGVTSANWIKIGGSNIVETLTGNTGGAVGPTANNINVLGDGTYITTVGNPSTSTLTIEGIGGSIVGKFEVDAFTGPGTNPVVPNSSGTVTVTGGQVAAGTTTHVIQTDSLAANTYTIQVQRSQAVASSTIGDNGVCHFNSADFSVDANGFVSSLAQSLNYTNVTHAASPYTVLLADNYISVDCSGGAVQLNFPNAPTFKSLWIVKDRTGHASANNITLTTPGGTVTFDGLTTYTMNSNYQAINLLANATPTYEVY